MIPSLDVSSRGIKTCVHKKICIRMFIAALFITAKKRKKKKKEKSGNSPGVHQQENGKNKLTYSYKRILSDKKE